MIGPIETNHRHHRIGIDQNHHLRTMIDQVITITTINNNNNGHHLRHRFSHRIILLPIDHKDNRNQKQHINQLFTRRHRNKIIRNHHVLQYHPVNPLQLTMKSITNLNVDNNDDNKNNSNNDTYPLHHTVRIIFNRFEILSKFYTLNHHSAILSRHYQQIQPEVRRVCNRLIWVI